MATISAFSSPQLLRLHHPTHLRHSSALATFPSFSAPFPFACLALRAARAVGGGRVKSHASAEDPALLRRPLASDPSLEDGLDAPFDSGQGGPSGEAQSRSGRWNDEEWVDWEDLIMQDTVPLVSFVRMILHSGKYGSGDRLSPQHEKAVLERLLPYHPEFEKKVGCGVDFITVGLHPQYLNSRCMFIVRKDGESIDFSYWKCIKGLIRKNYPLHADSFIIRHFPRRKY